MPLDQASTIQVLAGTLYGEARGLGILGMSDVGHVIKNRVALGRWGGIINVCRADEQFSCWNDDDPNRAKLLAAPDDDPHGWGLAMATAQGVQVGDLPDRTLRADSYFAVGIPAPYWARPPAVHTITLGAHSFWRVLTRRMIAPNVSVHAGGTFDAAERGPIGVAV